MDNDDLRFHLTYLGLLVCSFLVDPLFTSLLSGWQSPALHIYPAALVLIWIALWGRRRFLLEQGRRKALEERIKRLERRVNELETKDQGDQDWLHPGR